MARIIVPAHSDHLFWLANNMAQADRDEVEAGSGKGPFRALRDSMERSVVAWTALVNDEPVCMFGVTPMDILAGVGSPWLLGTDKVRESPVTMIKLNREYIPKMLELFPRLVNFVDLRHVVSIRWLRRLGFEFDPEPVAYGPFDMMFYRFHMERN